MSTQGCLLAIRILYAFQPSVPAGRATRGYLFPRFPLKKSQMMFENPEIFDHLARVLEFWPASDHFGAPQAPKITILRFHVVRIPEIWLKLALRPSREKIPNSRTTFLRIFGGPLLSRLPSLSSLRASINTPTVRLSDRT
ncbi:hypothetical protein K474DRAFT_1226259 [Panus rudis PR-1116 ss-1]|nr:hypothetical protein K474DRAFT_1226259 [Panus rudis PR-1116 ss-1]